MHVHNIFLINIFNIYATVKPMQDGYLKPRQGTITYSVTATEWPYIEQQPLLQQLHQFLPNVRLYNKLTLSRATSLSKNQYLCLPSW
jgi:hypothetical protein